MELINLYGRSKTPFIQQAEAGECGLACLAMVAGYYGLKTDISVLRQRYGGSARGATLNQIMAVAERIGFNAYPLRGELDALPHLTLPAILHWNLTHYVVLTRISRGASGRRYHIHDPARGVLVLREEEFSRQFTGVALDLLKSESFKAEVQQTRLKVSQLWTTLRGLWGSLRNILLLALVMQVVALASPFYMQIALDTVFPAFDRDLLKMLALGFGMLALVGLAAGWLRSLVIASLNQALSYQVVVNLFRHLTRLPLPWFEKRHVGDVVSRFGSTLPISQLLSQGMVAAFVDGVMAIFTLVLMFVYSIKLACIAVAAFLLYAGLRLSYLQALRLRNIDAITTAAKENSVFIETVRGISSIKAFGQEGNRQRMWQRSKADAVNAQIKLARLTASFDSLGSFVPAAERVIFLYAAIGLALEGQLTVGMIFAYQAYKQQFLDAAIRVVEQAINYKVMQVHLSRISDIALAPTELDGEDRQLDCNPDLSGGLKLHRVRYRYGNGEAEVLRGISMDVKPGEMVALIGPSGGGKTTLMKVMTGLFDPTQGQILVGGKPLSSFQRDAWRQSIGVVSQDDTLFAGSLAENIAFFDAQLDMELVEEVARLACIHDEIKSLPLGYDTPVGDMGSVLSGGQKQRVLLARALYKRPKMLFLDEGTAHLDPIVEAKVLESLASLDIIRVVIAHRSQSIQAADKIYLVMNGVLATPPANSSATFAGDSSHSELRELAATA